jgi:hypothetical protein
MEDKMQALILKSKYSQRDLIEYANFLTQKLNIPVIPLIDGFELKTIDSDNLDVYIAELQDLKKYKEQDNV